jgi:hypothetical protein
MRLLIGFWNLVLCVGRCHFLGPASKRRFIIPEYFSTYSSKASADYSAGVFAFWDVFWVWGLLGQDGLKMMISIKALFGRLGAVAKPLKGL